MRTGCYLPGGISNLQYLASFGYEFIPKSPIPQHCPFNSHNNASLHCASVPGTTTGPVPNLKTTGSSAGWWRGVAVTHFIR